MIYKLLYSCCYNILSIITEYAEGVYLEGHEYIHLLHRFASLLLKKVICLFKMFAGLANNISIRFWNEYVLHI